MKHILNFNDYLNESSKNPLELKKGDISEGKIIGGKFEDYEFIYDRKKKEHVVLEINYKTKPSISDVKKDLEVIKNYYQQEGVNPEWQKEVQLYEPKVGIIYPFVMGWTTGYRAYLTKDDKSEYENTNFPSEPTGKYAVMGGREVFKF
jgi:hypothetical protein